MTEGICSTIELKLLLILKYFIQIYFLMTYVNKYIAFNICMNKDLYKIVYIINKDK